MPWQKVRCWECGQVYTEELCRLMAAHVGDDWNLCPVCGCDYLLGFSDDESSINIR